MAQPEDEHVYDGEPDDVERTVDGVQDDMEDDDAADD